MERVLTFWVQGVVCSNHTVPTNSFQEFSCLQLIGVSSSVCIVLRVRRRWNRDPAECDLVSL
jgi:hypothetical protein